LAFINPGCHGGRYGNIEQYGYLARIHIKGTIVSLRNILLTVCCVEIQIVTNQYISKYLIINLLRFGLM
jgi:hypothetical protein